MAWFQALSNKNYRIALQLTNEYLRASKVKLSNELPEISQVEQWPIVSLDEAGDVLKQATQALAAKGMAAYWVLPTNDYRLLTLSRPKVPDNELADAIRWQIKEQIDFDIDEAIIEWFEFPEGLPGDERVFVVVTERSRIQQLVDITQAAGLEMQAIDISELAMRNLLLRQLHQEQNVAYLAESSAGLYVDCFFGDAFSFTRSINNVFFPKHQADEFTLEDIEPSPTQSLDAEADQTERLLLEVQRTLDYYESQVSRQAVTRLIISDFGEGSDSLAKALQDNLGVSAELIDLASVCQWQSPMTPQIIASRLALCGAALRDSESLSHAAN